MNFADRLIDGIKLKQTPLVVGLDPRKNRLPKIFGLNENSSPKEAADAYELFCKGIIDAVSPLVAGVKPQSAFFEMLGPAGMQCLHNLIAYAKSSGLLVIMDAKRGDIGSTAQAYARAFLGDDSNSGWACDCLTVNPYLGDDSLEPFVDRCRETDTGIFVLVRTSNPGGQMLQELVAEEGKVFSVVADHVQKLAADSVGEFGYGVVGAVVGATHPEQLAQLREQMPNSLFLVPGIGAQGATASDIADAFDDDGLGAVINSSRAIIFAHENDVYCQFGDDWQRAVESATRDTISQIAAETSAGKLILD